MDNNIKEPHFWQTDKDGDNLVYCSNCGLSKTLQALITEARIDELRPLQASVDRDDLLLLIEERLAKLDRSKQLKGGIDE